MALPKDMTVTQSTETHASEDDYEELCGVDLSDEEILLSFFKEGCNLDGSPVCMATQREPAPQSTYPSRCLNPYIKKLRICVKTG